MLPNQPEGYKSEIQLQAQCFQWAWNLYPETRYLLFAVPNGGSRNKAEAMQLKASGMVPGIPDLVFIWRGKPYAFELKTETGRLSPAQEKVHRTWEAAGFVDVHIVRSLEQFQQLFLSIIHK